MEINEMKNLIIEARGNIAGIESYWGDVRQEDNALICAQLAQAKLLTVIAACMVERRVQAEREVRNRNLPNCV